MGLLWTGLVRAGLGSRSSLTARVAFGAATGRLSLLRAGFAGAARVASGVATGRASFLRTGFAGAGVERDGSTGIGAASSWLSLAERRVTRVAASGVASRCACILARVS